jgi:hypothetical protein
MPRLTPAGDARAVDWIVAALTTFAESVVSLVPSGFAAYIRVFHPAYRAVGSELVPLRWADIAAANGKRAHARMQLAGITGSERFERGQPGIFDSEPDVGTLPPSVAGPLAAALACHTATPDRCWFAVWSGFGGLGAKARSGAEFELPGREYYLLGGPIEAATESLDEPWEQSANLWWPEDHAWCVATEVDLDTTYIGCSESCRDEILQSPELEAFEVDPESGIDRTSDEINPVG